MVQQLPCAAYANPWAKLVLGAGAMISPGILVNEVSKNIVWRKRKRLPAIQLYIDERAHAVTPSHIEREQLTGLAERIGSTSTVAKEGIGTAQAARVLRTDYGLAKRELPPTTDWVFCDTVSLLHDARAFTNILLEGTQGTGLDNVLGYAYPFVTSRHVTAAGLAADCGFGPRDIHDVIVVARTYPIRVAGNSGPFYPDSTEISWADLGVDERSETTTVTKEVRRVATFSLRQIMYAAQVNSATQIALTFVDYLAPEWRGRSGLMEARDIARIDRVGPLVEKIETVTGVDVSWLGTGPESVIERVPPGQ